ncbi:hypothetical protein ACOMHN_031925 [Nucella lapillus]
MAANKSDSVMIPIPLVDRDGRSSTENRQCSVLMMKRRRRERKRRVEEEKNPHEEEEEDKKKYQAERTALKAGNVVHRCCCYNC